MGNTNCCGIGVPFGFEPDKQSSDSSHSSHPLPPPHLAHLHPYSHSYPNLSSSPYRTRSPHHHPFHPSSFPLGPPPPHHSLPSPTPSSPLHPDDSIIRTFEQLRHFPPDIFHPPPPPPSSSLLLTHISSLDIPYPRVRQLVLDFNCISFVPIEIGLLRHLTELSLAGNSIASLPSSFYSLTALTFLNLGSNQLTHLSPSIGNLVHLSHLYLPSNRLTSLPSSLRRCERLQHLSLAENKLAWPEAGALVSKTIKKTSRSTTSTSHQPGYGGHGATPLSHLPSSVASSHATHYEASFPLPVSLTFLSLSSCHLSHIPSLLAPTLANLTYLDVSENFLRELPVDFHLLRRLRVLHLSCNDLTELLCPCEVERRKKAKEREERAAKRREKEEREDHDRRDRRGKAEVVEGLDEGAGNECADLSNVRLHTQQVEEEIEDDDPDADDVRDVTLSSNRSPSITSPHSASHLRYSFSASCFPDLNSLYLDSNFLAFPPPSSTAASPALSCISPCFLPFALRFLRLDNNPLLLCHDGIIDSEAIRERDREREKREKKISKHATAAQSEVKEVKEVRNEDGDRTSLALPPDSREVSLRDLPREERVEADNERERQRRESGSSANATAAAALLTIDTAKAARKRSVSFSSVVSYSPDPSSARRVQTAPMAAEKLVDDRFRHGWSMQAVLATLSAVQAVRSSSLRLDYRSFLPDPVIDQLFLGCWESAKNKHGLLSLHISHVLTVAQFPPLYPHLLTYKQVQVQDVVSEDILRHLDDAVSWLHDRRKEGRRILVHCRQGVSRSASIMIAYIMTHGTGDVQQQQQQPKPGEKDAERRDTDGGARADKESRERERLLLHERQPAQGDLTGAVDGHLRDETALTSSSSFSSPSLSPSPPPSALSSPRSGAALPRPPLPPPPPVIRAVPTLAMSFDAAFAYVQSKRPCISPNDGFKAQLRAYEEHRRRGMHAAHRSK